MYYIHCQPIPQSDNWGSRVPASPKTNFPATAALSTVVIQALSFAGGVEKLNTKSTLDIAIAIAVALSRTRVPNIATLINRHYLALFAVPIEIGGKFVDCKASKADSGTVLTSLQQSCL